MTGSEGERGGVATIEPAPQYVAVLGEPLPRNPGGKVLKAKLRDEIEWGEPLR